MREYFLELWQSKAAFRAALRGTLAVIGACSPMIPGVPSYVGAIAVALTQFIPAGQVNKE